VQERIDLEYLQMNPNARELRYAVECVCVCEVCVCSVCSVCIVCDVFYMQCTAELPTNKPFCEREFVHTYLLSLPLPHIHTNTPIYALQFISTHHRKREEYMSNRIKNLDKSTKEVRNCVYWCVFCVAVMLLWCYVGMLYCVVAKLCFSARIY